MLGDGIRFAALPLLAAAVTRRPLPVAVVTLSATVPWLLFGLYAGVAVDRLDRRSVMVAVNAARALTIGALAVVVATDHVSLPVLYAVAFVVGTGEVFYDLAAAAFLPAIVAADRLAVANARLISAQILGRDLVGAAIGGLLFAATRALPFSIDAATFAISAVLIASVTGSFRVSRDDVRGSVAAEIAEGLRYVVRDRLLRGLAVVAAAVNFAYMGQIAVLVLFAQRVLGLGSRGYGLLLASIAVGSVAGGLAAPRLAARVPRATLLVVVAASIGVLSIVVGSAAQTAVAVGGYVATGFAFMVWNVVSVSLRQATTPAAILGRTMSAYRIVAWGTLPLGSLAAGAIAGLGGLRLPFFVGGGLVVVVALASRRLLSAEPLVRPAGEEVPA